MSYLLVPVTINQISATGEMKKISSLVFTEMNEVKYAKKLCAFHIFHLHENNPELLPSVASVKFTRFGEVKVNHNTTITFGTVRVISVQQKQVLGRLKLFGYNKKLVAVNKPILLC